MSKSELTVVVRYEPPTDEAEVEDLRRRVVDCLLSSVDLTRYEQEDTITGGEGRHESS